MLVCFVFSPAGIRAENTVKKDTLHYLPPDQIQKNTVLAFRSNLLLPLLNIGIECPLSNRWSVAADFYYPWCPREWMNRWTEHQMECLQTLGGYIEGRYWFGIRQQQESGYGKCRLLGHSLGLIAGAAYYDMEHNGEGEQGEVFSVGIGYTYAFPLGKKGGVHLEIDIAVGAIYRIQHPYDVHESGGYPLYRKDENNVSIKTKSQWSMFPMKTGISLVAPVFSNRSLLKNGKRK